MILQIIDDVDLDNDGTIDYEEFLRALHPDFNETPNWFWQDENKEDSGPDEDDEEDDNKENDDGYDNIDFVDPDIDEDVMAEAKKLNSQQSKPKKAVKESDIVKQGYMQKEGKMIKSWKKRWFVLDNKGVLKYYVDEKTSKPISQVNVKSLTKLMNKSWSKTNKKRYGIKVYTPHRNWKFLLINNDQRAEWMSAFEKVSGKKAGNKPSKD